jgi:hypothetical protein
MEMVGVAEHGDPGAVFDVVMMAAPQDFVVEI